MPNFCVQFLFTCRRNHVFFSFSISELEYFKIHSISACINDHGLWDPSIMQRSPDGQKTCCGLSWRANWIIRLQHGKQNLKRDQYKFTRMVRDDAIIFSVDSVRRLRIVVRTSFPFICYWIPVWLLGWTLKKLNFLQVFWT